MDDALKARLIGAAVLVALAVILIPELLSGRKPESSDAATSATARGTRTVTIDLTGASPGAAAAPVAAQPMAPSAQGASAATTTAATPPVAADREPAAPPLASPTPQSTSPQPRPQPGVSPAAPAGTTTPQSPPTTKAVVTPALAIPARGGWAVQVGAFGATATADKLARELQSAGFKAYVSPVARSGKTLYRVRVGPEAERSRAEGLAASLKGRGLPATVVAND